MKVFLDANILFSGPQPHSLIRAFLLILFRHGKAVTNAYDIEEATRNLKAKFPDALPGESLHRSCRIRQCRGEDNGPAG